MSKIQKESLAAKYRRFDKAVQENISKDISAVEKMHLFLDFIIEYKFHGAYLLDYMQYKFYDKKKNERRKFIVHGKLIEIMRVCNDPESRKLFDQKPLFNREFKEYLGRAWVDSSNCTKQEFESFLEQNEKIFCKVPDGMFGKGIEVLNSADIKNVDEFYDTCKKNKTLLEEVLVQSDELAAFNDTAVNSMRMVTLVCADGSVKIMAAVLRLGRKGKFADNFHHEGIASLIDIETGIVYTTGVDNKWNRYVVHPDSGKPIVGFQIPYWNKITETVIQAAKVHPEVRYVGWDVAIKKDGQIVLIEGNPGADPDVTQIGDQVGKWPLYEPLLKEIRAVK